MVFIFLAYFTLKLEPKKFSILILKHCTYLVPVTVTVSVMAFCCLDPIPCLHLAKH